MELAGDIPTVRTGWQKGHGAGWGWGEVSPAFPLLRGFFPKGGLARSHPQAAQELEWGGQQVEMATNGDLPARLHPLHSHSLREPQSL